MSWLRSTPMVLLHRVTRPLASEKQTPMGRSSVASMIDRAERVAAARRFSRGKATYKWRAETRMSPAPQAQGRAKEPP